MEDISIILGVMSMSVLIMNIYTSRGLRKNISIFSMRSEKIVFTHSFIMEARNSDMLLCAPIVNSQPILALGFKA